MLRTTGKTSTQHCGRSPRFYHSYLQNLLRLYLSFWLLSLSPSLQSRVAVMCWFLDAPGHLHDSSPWPDTRAISPPTHCQQPRPALVALKNKAKFPIFSYNFYFCIYNEISAVIHNAMESHHLVYASYFYNKLCLHSIRAKGKVKSRNLL